VERLSSNSVITRIVWACTIAFFITCSVEIQATNLSFAWNPSPSTNVVGYIIQYGTVSGIYPYHVIVGTNTKAVVTGLAPGQTYYFAVTAYTAVAQSTDSNVVTNAVPLELLAQPMSQSVVSGSPLVLSVDVESAAPVGFQWFFDGNAIEGATNSFLILPQVSAGSAGSYMVVVSSAAGSVTSQVANVNVLNLAVSANGIGPAISAMQTGVYNGLFNATNSAGSSTVTETTTGSLSKCTIGPSGAYSAQVAVGGQAFAISGVFNGEEINSVINRSYEGLSNLNLILYAATALGTNRLAGIVSNMDTSNPWVALLSASLGTSAFPQAEDFVFLSPPPPGQASSNCTCQLMISTNGLVSLAGQLGDGTMVAQSTPLGTDGSFPVYQSLYGHTGLLAGWITLTGGSPVGNLTWIKPGSGAHEVGGFTSVISFGTGPGLSTNCFQPVH
jgi:Fibronectin type III domain